MLIKVALALAAVFLILISSEFLYRSKKLSGEGLRKFVHILTGCFVASWPWFLSWDSIRFISIAFLAVVLVAHYTKVFHALFSVKRKSYGDVLFAVAVGACALLTEDKVFFSIAMLSMALADGVAALVGSHAHKKWQYKIFGQKKTVLGTMAFWLAVLCILGFMLPFASLEFNVYLWALVLLPPSLSLVENVAVFGLDNAAVPIAAVLMLSALAQL